MSDQPEDDATVIRPLPGPSPAPSAPPGTAFPPTEVLPSEALAVRTTLAPREELGNALPVGTRLAEFEVQRVLGEGGFGIVYLAWDHQLERQVALKEYMPAALALRSEGSQVRVRSERHADTFAAGLKSFINEAKLLAQFDHRSLVKVFRFWEAGGTAYMVMPYVVGQTLKDYLRAQAEPPDEAWLMALLAPLTEALQVLHAERCYHRDIAPDNIILLAGSGLPLLLDFGAARRVIGDMTQALTVILKPGYAPIEQYAEVPGMKQGPWTDVYALGAVVYNAITGKIPPPSVGRLVQDQYQPLEQLAAGRYSARLIAAVDRALQVKPESRTPDIAAFRADLGLAPMGQATPASETVMAVAPGPRTAAPTTAAPTTVAPGPATASTGIGRWLGGGLLALGLLGGALWWFGLRDRGSDAPTARGTPVAAPAASVAAAVPAPAPVKKPPPDLPTQFQQVLAQQSPDFSVSAYAERSRLRIDVDELRFTVKSSRDGHVTVLLYGPDGELTQIFPNERQKDDRIKADRPLRLPSADWPLIVSDPPGHEHFLVVVSEAPRTYPALHVGVAYGFKTLATRGEGDWLLGQFECSKPDCSKAWGAAVFTVDAYK